MKFLFKFIVVLALLFLITAKNSFIKKSNLLILDPTPPVTKATPPVDKNKRAAMLNTFKDINLKKSDQWDTILNNSFLRYIFDVAGYTLDVDLGRCIDASSSQNKLNAISAFKKIWANKDQAVSQIPIILQNIQCAQISDLATKLTGAVLDTVITEIKQFIKTMKLFLKMFK